MLTFFEKQIYFILIIIIFHHIPIKKKEIKSFYLIFLFTISLFFDYFLHMRLGSSSLIGWFLIFHNNLNNQFFSLLVLYILYLNNFNSLFVIILNYLFINSFLGLSDRK